MASQGILNLSLTVIWNETIRMKRKLFAFSFFCAISIHQGWVKQKLGWIIIAHFLVQREWWWYDDDGEKGRIKFILDGVRTLSYFSSMNKLTDFYGFFRMQWEKIQNIYLCKYNWIDYPSQKYWKSWKIM
jgi:hypothetical protein